MLIDVLAGVVVVCTCDFTDDFAFDLFGLTASAIFTQSSGWFYCIYTQPCEIIKHH